MITTLQKFPSNCCCLCGSSVRLTAEHKIKASALRKVFGKESLMVGTFGITTGKMKSAQSSNSKHLKFNILICETCNTSRTQQADREFDNFHNLAVEELKINKNPELAFNNPRYIKASACYLNLFRYFAKLLSCHIAAVDAPIPATLAKFAIGESNINRIWLQIKTDQNYTSLASCVGEYQYAAHGGLIVYGDKDTSEPKAFGSTITIGPIQYVFYTDISLLEKAEIRESWPEFLELCITKIEEAKINSEL